MGGKHISWLSIRDLGISPIGCGINRHRDPESRQAQLCCHIFQCGQKLSRIIETILRINGGSCRDKLIDEGGDAVDKRTRCRHDFRKAGVCMVEIILARKRRGACEQLKEHNACRIHVAGRPDLTALNLLRGKISHRAHNLIVLRLAGVSRSNQAEIRQFHLVITIDQHVVRLDIPVHHARPVGSRETREHPTHNAHSSMRGHRSPLSQQLTQGAASD